MKKIMSIVLSAAILMSIAVGTAFAAESVASKTGTDADAGNVSYTMTGTGKGLRIDVKVTDASESEESALKNASGSLSDYANAQVADTAAKLLGTTVNNTTVNEIKQMIVSGYEDGMGDITISVPFAALPPKGTSVAVVLKVVRNDVVNWVTVPGVVEEKTFVGSAKLVPCVTFTLDGVTMLNVQNGTATVAVVSRK